METSTSPLQWLDVIDRDPRLVGTALKVIEERARRARRKGG